MVDAATASAELRADQADLLWAITRSGRGVETITGPASASKTRALAVAADAWARCQMPVRGVAVAAITADGLEQVTGAPSTSLARLLADPARHVPPAGVLLLDEAGMVGTRQLARLNEATCAMRCKLILVGDPAQLPEMEAGGLFEALTRLPNAIILTGHHRQVDAWEAVALEAFRDGHSQTAFDAYADHGRLHTADTIDTVRERLVHDYLAARVERDDPRQVLILARTRAHASTLNHAVRSGLLADGRLSQAALHVHAEDGDIDFRVGDEVIGTRNLHSAHLFNGTRATVTNVGLDGLVLTTPTGGPVALDRHMAGRVLDHGYALTIHKAQGITVERALLWADPGLYRQAAYVGLSRAREATHVYVPPTFDPVDDLDCGASSRWPLKRTDSAPGVRPRTQPPAAPQPRARTDSMKGTL